MTESKFHIMMLQKSLLGLEWNDQEERLEEAYQGVGNHN